MRIEGRNRNLSFIRTEISANGRDIHFFSYANFRVAECTCGKLAAVAASRISAESVMPLLVRRAGSDRIA